MHTALTVIAAYLIGSVSFAVVVSRLMRLPDPRSYGSKNPGATNVLRSGSRAAAALTLAGDAGKGWLAVFLALLFDPEAAALAGLAAFLGHLYPLFHRFQGGKGVSTAAGVLIGLDPWLGLATLLTWVIIAVFFRYASLASLIAALFAPLFAWTVNLSVWVVFAVAIIAVLLVWRHRGNIARLLAGQESRIGHKKVSPPPDPSAASR
ncbi:MAG: glycerol-3-phosphate 1-O-acyltransferase PlsY [Pseudomonadota bacterium]|nr:glycerol-3-phosphate 1-O-acyltransferase PlsY [Pseudomonadota bacterium]